eukprot:6210032-Pleurochrysis_carterae.AAC.1
MSNYVAPNISGRRRNCSSPRSNYVSPQLDEMRTFWGNVLGCNAQPCAVEQKSASCPAHKSRCHHTVERYAKTTAMT